MQEIQSIQLQLERQALTLSNRIHKIYMALEELLNLSLVLIELTPKKSDEITKWLKNEEFKKDEKGFYKSVKSEKASGNKVLSSATLTYHWPATLSDSKDVRFLFFALRNIGTQIKRINQWLDQVTIIYFQDIKNSTCLAFPYFDMSQVIPSDFDWTTYHAYQSIEAQKNPERHIKWSPPNIDYAGKGLISIVSIPCYIGDNLIGLWSIDVPHISIHKNCIVDTIIPSQINFIADYSGKLIAHPTIDVIIDKEKGAFFQGTCADIKAGFKNLDFDQIVHNRKGYIEIHDGEIDTILIYQTIPEIEWILFSHFSKDVMLQSVQTKIKKAFERMKDRHLPEAIDFSVGNEVQVLVDSYNDMVSVLSHHQQKREQAQKEAYEAQRTLNEKLETLVNQRTQDLEALNDKFRKLANTDPLTGINNRRSFFEHTDVLLRLLEREGNSSSLLMIDLDYFKKINDTHGHNIGDEVLKHFAKNTSNLLRSSDIFARYGGEEFIAFLPNTESTDALEVAEKIREHTETHSAREVNVHYTVSLGVSVYFKDLDTTLQKADNALYKAKHNGRNRVELSE